MTHSTDAASLRKAIARNRRLFVDLRNKRGRPLKRRVAKKRLNRALQEARKSARRFLQHREQRTDTIDRELLSGLPGDSGNFEPFGVSPLQVAFRSIQDQHIGEYHDEAIELTPIQIEWLKNNPPKHGNVTACPPTKAPMLTELDGKSG